MKQPQKQQRWVQSSLIGLALASSITLGLAAPDIDLGTFDIGIDGTPNWGRGWGNVAPVFDPAQDNTGNGGGACYLYGDYAVEQNTLNVYGCNGGNPWWHPIPPFDMTQYKSLEFDIKWDTVNSTLSISNFNANPGGDGGIAIWSVFDGSNWPTIKSGVQIPEAAATGWAHVSVPIDPAIPNLGVSYGIMLKKWIPSTTMATGGTYGFWLDNVVLKGSDAPPPPPTLSFDKPVPGLAFVAASGGQYDRQEIRTVGVNYTWIGQPGPVSYSVDVAKIGESNPSGFQFFMHLVPGIPNPTVSSSDYSEPHVVMWRIMNNADGSAWSDLRYKTNSPNSNGVMWDASTNGTGFPGGLWNSTPVGTWTITFNQDTNIIITAPNGGTLTNTLPSVAVDIFRNYSPNMQINIGAVPGELTRVGQMAVITGARITGTPEPNINSNFLGVPRDTNIWTIVASSPNYGVQEIPTDAVYWVDWTLPAPGFSLTKSPSVTGPWTGVPATGFEGGGKHRELIRQGDLPGTDGGFFRLLKRQFTKLQILLPGETAAPGTPTGKTNTPDPQTAWIPFDLVVNAVDNEWYRISGVNDTIHLSSTDVTFTATDTPLANGTATFIGCFFGQIGNWTVTAEDVTDNTKTSDTSSAVSVPQ